MLFMREGATSKMLGTPSHIIFAGNPNEVLKLWPNSFHDESVEQIEKRI